MNIQVGDSVKFNARGRTIQGVVTDIKYSRPGSRSFKRFGLSGLAHAFEVRKLEVRPDDGNGVWTVPERNAQKTGKAAPHCLRKSMEDVSRLKADIANHKAKRLEERITTADNSGLLDLERGDDIEVKFREIGWARRKFYKITGSGKVAYYRDGDFKFDAWGKAEPRVRFSSPQFVRKPERKET